MMIGLQGSLGCLATGPLRPRSCGSGPSGASLKSPSNSLCTLPKISAMATATNTNITFQTPTSATYSHTGSEFPATNADDGREQWSGDASDPELDENGSKKRKRPMSVSCELCKQRKVKCQ